MTTEKVIENYLIENNLDLINLDKSFELRFELGDNLENGTSERVQQATERAFKIFQSFIEENNLCLIEIDDYNEKNVFDKKGSFKNYIYTIISLTKIKRLKGPFDIRVWEKDNRGNIVWETLTNELHHDIVLGITQIKYSEVEKIITGIVNLEMGFKPKIMQDVYFYDLKKQIGFRIYDDRGCYIWADDKEKLKPIYQKFKDWIVENEKDIKKEEFK